MFMVISVNAKIPTYLEKPALIYLRKAVEVKREPVQTPVDHSELFLSPAFPCLLQLALKALQDNPQVEKPSSKVKVGGGMWRLSFSILLTDMVWTFEGC